MTADDKEPRRRRLSDDERVLWRGVIRSVSPLRRRRLQVELLDAEPERNSKTPAAAAKPPAPVRPPRSAPAAKPAPPPLAPLERRTKQRLARGSESIDGRIDLHGRTQSQAHAALLRFLESRQTQGARIVLVITGKGARSKQQVSDFGSERGVLKRQVPLWLNLPEFRRFVVAVEEAHIGHGGEGALYVRLRRIKHSV
jgi:DNA-nicking Smr family endonuclease